MSPLRENLFNAALFQLGWLACVFGAQRPWLLAIALVCLAVHLCLLARPGEWRGLLTITLIGCVLDSLLLHLDVFDFGEGLLLPAWLALLWALFASTLRHSLAWSARPWWLGSLLGALGAPLSYLGGARLAGVELPQGLWPTLILLAVIWAGVIPVAHRLVGNFRSR